jgi:hypothetical protein
MTKRADTTTRKGKLDRETQDAVFKDLDALGKKYGALALPGMRRYLNLYSERSKRQKEIARLEAELREIKAKG